MRRKLASRELPRHDVHEHGAGNTKTSAIVLQTLTKIAKTSNIVLQI